MVTREPFAGLSHAEVVVWYGFIVISTAVFVWGAAQLVAKYRRGRAEALDHPGERLARMVRTTFSHARLARRDRTAGVGHALIFFGFLLLFGGTTVLGIQTDLATPLLHWQFWQGGFYLGYQLCLDVAGLALLAGLCVMAAKRWIARPARLDYGRVDGAPGDERRTRYRVGDQIFVASLFFLAVTGFLLEGFWLAQTHPSYGGWSPVGWVLAAWFRAMGLTGAAAGLAHHVLWWVHGLVALAFVACIPYTKAVHMLAAPATVAVRDPRAGRHLVPVAPDADPEDVGYGRITDLSWRHLLSLDACTKCGKCHEACPARASGYPLSPRDLILDLREAAEAATGIHASVKLGPRGEPDALLVGQALRPETLWSCMQCMACVEICPVEIEHVPIINQLRRRLVEEGELDPLLQSTLETIHKSGNSFGEAKRKRGRWTGQLDFPVKDIRREPAQLLWFVGDYASFDPRNQQASRALATVLHHAGVDFGILFDAERTGGCDVRRVGEEG
ncbi:MAG TPA: (Fe-S)-binding protein, partial [Acidimicrobiales bacterium]|nr:(Fe-S)-binding protein [Acidimicrobiales bacterium]